MPMGSDMFMYSLQAAGCRRYAGAWGVSREGGAKKGFAGNLEAVGGGGTHL